MFNTISSVYGSDVVLKPKEPKPPLNQSMEHEIGWKHSLPVKKSVYKSSLGRYPEYLSSPMKVLERKEPFEGEEPPPGFKNSLSFKSLTSPSVMFKKLVIKSKIASYSILRV